MTYKTIKPEICEAMCLPRLTEIASLLEMSEATLKDRLSYYRNEGERSLTGGELVKIADHFGIRREVFSYLGKEKVITPTPTEMAIIERSLSDGRTHQESLSR